MLPDTSPFYKNFMPKSSYYCIVPVDNMAESMQSLRHRRQPAIPANPHFARRHDTPPTEHVRRNPPVLQW